jgi:SAM-dependent methyltransferase
MGMINLHDPSLTSQGTDPFRQWLGGVSGQYLLAWESQQLDSLLANWFGYQAVQLGLGVPGGLAALAASRMSHRVVVETGLERLGHAQVLVDGFESLPFASESLDLVVMPHTLEFASNPHEVCREAARVLRPEGRLVILGLNPMSLWRLQQGIGRSAGAAVLPKEGQWIGLPRVRDWLKLLSCEVDNTQYGLYRPLCGSDRWLQRFGFMERAGDWWWPICGAVYMISAVKRVSTIRLIGPAWKTKSQKARTALRPVANQWPAAPAPSSINQYETNKDH